MPKVLLTPMTLANEQGPFLDILREAGLEPVYPPEARQVTEEDLLTQLSGVSFVLAGAEPYTERLFQAHPQLRCIARVGVGFDAVDLQAATAHGIVVTNAPHTNHHAVAEHTFALMLALAKNVVPGHVGVQAGGWPRTTTIPLRGQTLGLAGLGRIGKAVAALGLAFQMRVVAYDPFPDHAFAEKHSIPLVSFDQLLTEADFLSLHLPLSPDAKHLINRTTLAKMKPTAYLINTARGGLVCEADVLQAITSGQLAGAGLDVFEQEPPGKQPLYDHPRVVVTPHNAGMDLRSRDDMALSAAQAVVDLVQGRWPTEKVVNPEVKGTFTL